MLLKNQVNISVRQNQLDQSPHTTCEASAQAPLVIQTAEDRSYQKMIGVREIGL